MTALATVAGFALILLALRDVFDTLFHPHGRSILGERLIRVTFRTVRRAARRRPAWLSIAGPAGFLLVIFSWVVLIVVGAALIMLPHLPDKFVFAPGIDPSQQSDIWDAVYLSLVNLTSLGYGDVVPSSELLRLLGPLQALFGLGILTASISWIISIYRATSDARSLAREVGLACDAEQLTGLRLADLDSEAVTVFDRLVARLAAVRRDFVQFPIAYYFHGRDPDAELSVSLALLLPTISASLGEDRPDQLRLQATRLQIAVDELLALVDAEFHDGRGGTAEQILERWRRDHFYEESTPAH
jgi:hypothetical protein